MNLFCAWNLSPQIDRKYLVFCALLLTTVALIFACHPQPLLARLRMKTTTQQVEAKSIVNLTSFTLRFPKYTHRPPQNYWNGKANPSYFLPMPLFFLDE